MASVGLGKAEVSDVLTDGVVVACENSPNNTTISGDRNQLEEVINHIREDKPSTFLRKLQVDNAYHSRKRLTYLLLEVLILTLGRPHGDPKRLLQRPRRR